MDYFVFLGLMGPEALLHLEGRVQLVLEYAAPEALDVVEQALEVVEQCEASVGVLRRGHACRAAGVYTLS